MVIDHSNSYNIGQDHSVWPHVQHQGGSVAEWLACWTQAQKGLGSNHSCDPVG